MGVSHIALAVKNIEATHEFYTESMGFDLVKTEVAPRDGGFVRHVFYSTGPVDDQMIAFWDLSNVPGKEEIRTDISRELGHSPLTNHIAFTADSVEDLERRKQRLLDRGHVVLEIDHGWILSIYTEDPDGISVEFAVVTRPFTDHDRSDALRLLREPNPGPAGDEPVITLHEPDGTSTPVPVGG